MSASAYEFDPLASGYAVTGDLVHRVDEIPWTACSRWISYDTLTDEPRGEACPECFTGHAPLDDRGEVPEFNRRETGYERFLYEVDSGQV